MMKHILVALVMVASLAACGDDNGKLAGGTTQEEIQARFAPLIQGAWVSTGYMKELKATGSPKAAWGKLTGIGFMNIDPVPFAGDTIIVAATLNGYENYTFYAFYRQGQDDKSIATAYADEDNGTFYELSYDIQNQDTFLVLNHYDKDNRLLDARQFSKLTGAQTDNSQPYGLGYAANKVLFSGTYTATDENGGKSEVTLTDDGMATGMGIHTTYYVFTDFSAEEETNLDEMLFDERTKTQKPYIFEIKGDTILLYKASENEDRTLLIRGDLKYTLVRK